MVTDWAGTGAMFQGLAALLAAGAAAATAAFGVMALGTWRAEMIGRRRATLAEDLLALAYEAQDAIKRARSPFSYSGEGETLVLPAGVDEVAGRYARSLYAIAERLFAKPEFWASFEAVRFRTRAFFGDPAWFATEEILAARSRVINASSTLARYALRPNAPQPSRKLLESYESLIWLADPVNDETSQIIDKAVATLVAACGKEIAARAT